MSDPSAAAPDAAAVAVPVAARATVGILLGEDAGAMDAVVPRFPSVRFERLADAVALRAVAPSLSALIAAPKCYGPEVAGILQSEARALAWIQTGSSGTDVFLRHGVPDRVVLTNAASAWAPTVAEHAMALLLALARDLPGYERARRERRWDRSGIDGRLGSLDGGTLAIVGFGAIGRAVARRARPFGMTIVAVNRRGDADPDADRAVPVARLGEALAAADAIVLCVPAGPATRGLIDARAFATMKPTARLVNVARGDVVDQTALEAALRSGRIAGAACDVLTPEPLPPESTLWDCPNLLMTPHVGAWGGAGRRRLGELVAERLARFLRGEPLTDVRAGS